MHGRKKKHLEYSEDFQLGRVDGLMPLREMETGDAEKEARREYTVSSV